MTRTILHADMDAFYASVEQRDHAELRGKPVVVGGSAEGRGVVAAASYEARAFGVHSAMPMSRALRLCPEAVRVSPRFDRYAEVSRQVMAIFRAVTPLVEPLSLDEAFMDITDHVEAMGGAEQAARNIKAEVRRVTALNVSIGGGANKTVAKIASDTSKPDGLLVIAPGEERAFLAPMPVRRLWGVGRKADEVLASIGVRTIGDLAGADSGQLARVLGSRGTILRDMARGIDERPVEPVHERKSIGAETTFAHDLPDSDELRAELRRITDEVARRLGEKRLAALTVTLKLRYGNFHTITRRTTRSEPVSGGAELERTAAALLDAVVTPGDRFRLIGVSCSQLRESLETAQLSLWPPGGD